MLNRKFLFFGRKELLKRHISLSPKFLGPYKEPPKGTLFSMPLRGIHLRITGLVAIPAFARKKDDHPGYSATERTPWVLVTGVEPLLHDRMFPGGG